MTRYCCVCHAEQSMKNSYLVFHRFPSNPDTLKKWLEVLKQENAKGRVICSQHFKAEDYRELCDKALLKTEAIPSLNIHKLDTDVQSIRNNEQNPEHSIIPMEFHKEIDGKDESANVENVPRESTVSIGSVKSLKRIYNSCDESITLEKKRCYINKFGIFRREDFIDKIKWNQFVTAYKQLKKENLLLQRKNKRLLKKIKTFNDIIKQLKKKKLTTDTTAEILNVR